MNEGTTSAGPRDEPPSIPPSMKGRGTSTSPVQYRGYHVRSIARRRVVRERKESMGESMRGKVA